MLIVQCVGHRKTTAHSLYDRSLTADLDVIRLLNILYGEKFIEAASPNIIQPGRSIKIKGCLQ